MFKCTSTDKIEQIKDITPETAKQIRQIWKGDNAGQAATIQKRQLIDKIAGTHGVEYLGINKRTSEPVFYCNAGDPYATTIIFIGHRLIVGDWGTMVERNQIKD